VNAVLFYRILDPYKTINLEWQNWLEKFGFQLQ
jgi:hypothetical protein